MLRHARRTPKLSNSEPKISVAGLTDAQETLLLPLWARAMEHRNAHPIVQDSFAVQLVDTIDYDFEKLRGQESRFVGFCIRSSIFDRLAQERLAQFPDTTVVEMGAGLDTRFDRIDNGRLRWFDIDLPAVTDLRKELFSPDERRKLITGSISEHDTFDAIPPSSDPPLFIAEGVLYFLTKAQVLELLLFLADRYPGCSIVLDAQSPFFLWYSNLLHPLRSSKLTWSLGSVSQLTHVDSRIQVTKYVGFGDAPYYSSQALGRLPWHQRLAQRYLPTARGFFKVCQLALGTQ